MKLKDILILIFVLTGAIAIFLYSSENKQIQIVNQEAKQGYVLQTRPEILFRDKVELKARVIDSIK